MIKMDNVSKYYNSNNVVALGLRKVNLELYANEFVAIVGESGSGKTTLLNVITGMDTYEDGEIYVNGEETSYFSIDDMENFRKKYVAFVFQNYNLIDSYTVLQNVEAPLILSNYPKDKLRERAMEIIRRVGLEDFIHHKSTKLSGGQKQRVVIARALAKDCPIIAADEPTGNLDSKSAREVIELLAEIAEDKLVIMVTHDYNQVKDFATRKIRLFDGEVVEDTDMKKVEKTELPHISEENTRLSWFENIKMAGRNLLAVPKKTLLMILVFSFFSFFVALAYGAFNLSSEMSDYNYNMYFQNNSISRLVVRKTDKSAFTDSDFAAINELDPIKSVVKHDYVLDYSASYFNESEGDGRYSMYMNGYFLPLDLVDEDVLAAGSMPENENEIVIAMPSYNIDSADDYVGVTFESNLFRAMRSEDSLYPLQTITVSGVVDSSEIHMRSGRNYFLIGNSTFESLHRYFYTRYTNRSQFIPDDSTDSDLFENRMANMPFKIDDTLPDNTIAYPKSFAGPDADLTVEGTLEISDYYRDLTLDDITIAFTDKDEDYGIYMNENTYERFAFDDVYQISVLTGTDYGIKGLQKDIENIGGTVFTGTYKAVYPYASQTESQFSALVLLLQSIGMVMLIFVTMVGSTLLTYLIFRAIINTKLHDYAIFRTIGANQGIIRRFIYIENLYVTVIAYVIFLSVALSVGQKATTNSIFYPIKTYSWVDYIIFLGLLVLMSLVVSSKYCKRIFKSSVSKTMRTEGELR